MLTISEALEIALQHHHQGQVQAAEVFYRQILNAEPNHPNANYLLGLLVFNAGQYDEATERFERVTALFPEIAVAHASLAEAYRQRGHYSDAITSAKRGLEIDPTLAEAHLALGHVWKEQADLPRAIECYQAALRHRPDFAAAWSDMGIAYTQMGAWAESVDCLRHAIALNPQSAEAYNDLGIAWIGQGKFADAADALKRAIELKPTDSKAHNNLGNALRELGRLDEAEASCRRALELAPNSAEACINLGNAIKEQKRLSEALDWYRRAVELKPNFAVAYHNLAVCYREGAQIEDAIASNRAALKLDPNYVTAHDDLLLSLQYRQGVTLAQLADEHAFYDCQHAARFFQKGRTWPNSCDEQRPIRVGFVSPNLSSHPVGFFLVGLLENLNRGQISAVCYSDQVHQDDVTRRLQAKSEWRDVAGLRDEKLYEQILADRIDILFDLAGHTRDNRLLVFARQAAPLQLTWAGYVGTTGLRAMDGLLADRFHVPEQHDSFFQERVLRMPHGYVCYAPPENAPPVSPLPALQSGQVTFACFNNPTKITREIVAVWSKILRRLPGARIVFKYEGWTNQDLVERFTQMFGEQEIGADRLEFLGPSPHAQFLAEYHRIDLALDTHPYSGGLTTCEALWMGVPVITCPGETFASRHSLSHLSNVGLTETIGRDLQEYEELAVSLSQDLPKLAELRRGLRERVAASPLCDTRRFAADFYTLLRNEWRQWLQKKGSIAEPSRSDP